MNRKIVFLLCLVLAAARSYGQSNLREGNNNFARFTKTGDIKHLIEARKFADQGFKIRRDSLNYDHNLLRALVYSTLAYADSNRTQKYDKDPLDEGLFMLNRLKDENLNFENAPQIKYSYNKLASGHLIRAKRELKNNQLKEAFRSFKLVDSLGRGEIKVKHNLAVLSERLDDLPAAISYYTGLVENRATAEREYVLALAQLHLNNGDLNATKNTLLKGREYYPKDRDILFKLMNLYASNGNYEVIIPLLTEALAMEPQNVELNYLAGFSHEMTGNKSTAENFYKKAIELDPNDYNSNYELGLLYLRDFVGNTEDYELQYKAQEYLLRANQINPNAVNALKSLSVLFSKAGNYEQLDRVNNQLSQIISN